MTVMKFYTLEETFTASDIKSLSSEVKTHELLVEGVLYNCSARIERNEL